MLHFHGNKHTFARLKELKSTKVSDVWRKVYPDVFHTLLMKHLKPALSTHLWLSNVEREGDRGLGHFKRDEEVTVTAANGWRGACRRSNRLEPTPCQRSRSSRMHRRVIPLSTPSDVNTDPSPIALGSEDAAESFQRDPQPQKDGSQGTTKPNKDSLRCLAAGRLPISRLIHPSGLEHLEVGSSALII